MRIATAYRMTLFLGIVNSVSGLLAFALLGNTAAASVTTEVYGMSLASYLVSGVAFSPIVNNGLALFYRYTAPSQLEEVLLTPTGFRQFLILSATPGLLAALANSVFLFSVCVYSFGLAFSYDALLLLAFIGLGICSSIGLGLMGLGFQLVYKQTTVLSWLFYTLAGLLGNMIVPVEILPNAIRVFSYLTPQYYFFTGIRTALGSDVMPSATILLLFALYTMVLLGTGFYVLERGRRFLRRNGTHSWT